MTDSVYRMRLFHSLSVPRHIAFKKGRGRNAHRVQSGQALVERREKPPPGWHSPKGHTHAALKAADPALWRKTSRIFFAFWHFTRCRGPPFSLNFKNSD